MSDFTGKNVLVIGGSRGIGAAIVSRFAEDGAQVAFTYAGSADAASTLASASGAIAIRSDAAKRDELVATVGERGALDILVVNAGLAVLGDALELDPDAIDRMIDVNVRSPYHASVEAGRRMNDNGRIIIIGSTNGDRIPFAGGAAYAMTKSAMQGMGRGLARDFGPRGITVNVVQPGPIDTDMNPADGPMAETMHSFLAVKRHGHPDEVAALVAYLAGPDAAFITGSLHNIDGAFAA